MGGPILCDLAARGVPRGRKAPARRSCPDPWGAAERSCRIRQQPDPARLCVWKRDAGLTLKGRVRRGSARRICAPSCRLFLHPPNGAQARSSRTLPCSPRKAPAMSWRRFTMRRRGRWCDAVPHRFRRQDRKRPHRRPSRDRRHHLQQMGMVQCRPRPPAGGRVDRGLGRHPRPDAARQLQLQPTANSGPGYFAGLPLDRTPRHQASVYRRWVTPVAGVGAWGSVIYHGRETAAGARIAPNGRPVAFDADGTAIS